MREIQNRIRSKVEQSVRKNTRYLMNIAMIISAIYTGCFLGLYRPYSNFFNNIIIVLSGIFLTALLFLFIPRIASFLGYRKEIKMLLKEDLSCIEPINFNVKWEYAKTLMESIAGSTISADMNAEKIFYCKEPIDNNSKYHVIELLGSKGTIFVAQKAN